VLGVAAVSQFNVEGNTYMSSIHSWSFATPAHVIRGFERPFYEWTGVNFSEPSQEYSLGYSSFLPPPFLSAQQHLEENQCYAMFGEYRQIHI